VTTTSALRAISSVNFCGRSFAMSIPFSRITSTRRVEVFSRRRTAEYTLMRPRPISRANAAPSVTTRVVHAEEEDFGLLGTHGLLVDNGWTDEGLYAFSNSSTAASKALFVPRATGSGIDQCDTFF